MTLPFAPRTVDLYGESTAPFPFIAKTTQIKAPVSPIAFDYVKIITVRDGSAVVFSEFGRKSVKFGDVIVLAANVPCGSEPEDYVTATTIYVDTDYVLDQVRWQYAGLLRDRLDVQGLAEAMYSEPVQILRLGEDRVSELTSWLDELVMLSSNGDPIRHYCRMQALWFQIMHVIAPFIKVTPLRVPWFRHENKRPALPKGRSTGRLRAEVRQVADRKSVV